MLQPVAVGHKSLADYTHLVGRPLVEEIRELAEALQGPQGPPPLRDRVRRRRVRDPLHAGAADARRRHRGRVAGDDGARGVLQRDQAACTTRSRATRSDLRRASGTSRSSTTSINAERARARAGTWSSSTTRSRPAMRKHVPGQGEALGVALPHRPVDAATRQTIERLVPHRRATTTRASSTCRSTCRPALDGKRPPIHICPPAIDPLSPKNMALSPEDAAFVCDQFGIDVDRPLICQVSRFDPWKDPLGVIDAYRDVNEEMPEVQLALVGSMATDDPEGWEFFNSTLEYADGDPDIKILNNLNNVGAIEVNAFQSQSDVVIQKSTREGFGLTVSEALWKARPFIGGDVGGIPLQVQDGETGYLVSSPEECAERVARDPARAGAGQAARPRRQGARAQALPDAASPARLAADLQRSPEHDHEDAPLVLVSNRGPATFERDDDGRARGDARRRRARDGADGAGESPRRALDRVGDERRGRGGEPRARRQGVRLRGRRRRVPDPARRVATPTPTTASTTWSRTRCCGSSSTTSGTSRTRRTSASTRSTPTSRATAWSTRTSRTRCSRRSRARTTPS